MAMSHIHIIVLEYMLKNIKNIFQSRIYHGDMRYKEYYNIFKCLTVVVWFWLIFNLLRTLLHCAIIIQFQQECILTLFKP